MIKGTMIQHHDRLSTAKVMLAACLLICCAGHADAATIDYALGSQNSTQTMIWSEGGVASTIEGRNISVKDVIGVSTPSNAGISLPFNDALFNFSSGTFSNSNGNLYNYNSNGSFNVTGSFDLNGNGSIEQDESNVTLLSGSIGPLTLDRSESSRYSISNAALSVTSYPLASYFGYPAATLFNGIFNLSFSVSALPEDFQGGGSTNGDISTSPVPVPAAALLMFSGLAGLFGVKRRSEGQVCS